MRDTLDESLTHPKPFPLERYSRLLVLAAHPDDEVYGCGGLIALARRWDKEVRVHVAAGRGWDAASAAVADMRRAESLRAATVLGCQIEFGEQIDRGMRMDSEWVAQLRDLFVRYQPDLVLAPALCDYHPDHQALALTAVRAFEAIAQQADLAFYETIGTLASPTHIVDITDVHEVKRRAMGCFASQERHLPYAEGIEARDRFRALPLAPRARHAEVFHLASCRGVRGWGAVLPALADGVRQSLGALEHPAGAPLVSVLIRTIGDPRLLEAVASVAAQTYRPLEIVVAAASDRDPWGVIERASHLPNVRVVSEGRALSRPQAANLALRHARGDWLIFLDDDDYWLPSHLEGLVATAMHQAGSALAVCAGVEVRDANGRVLKIYANDPDRRAMALTNQVPIHSVLFRRSLAAELGCRFDESLPILEDWDFWLQVLQHSPILRIDAVTAVYRWTDRSQMFRDEELLRRTRRRIHDKWFERLGWDVYQAAIEHAHARLDAAERETVELAEHVAGLTAELERVTAKCQAVEKETVELAERVAGRDAELTKLREQLMQSQSEKESVDRELEAVRAELRAVLGSRSWRVTRPLRAARERLIALLGRGS